MPRSGPPSPQHSISGHDPLRPAGLRPPRRGWRRIGRSARGSGLRPAPLSDAGPTARRSGGGARAPGADRARRPAPGTVRPARAARRVGMGDSRTIFGLRSLDHLVWRLLLPLRRTARRAPGLTNRPISSAENASALLSLGTLMPRVKLRAYFVVLTDRRLFLVGNINGQVGKHVVAAVPGSPTRGVRQGLLTRSRMKAGRPRSLRAEQHHR